MDDATPVLSFDHYRQRLAALAEDGAAVVSLDFARRLAEAAAVELEHAHGEYTVAQAVEISGRSRSWFERRLPQLAADGLARQIGGAKSPWLLKGAAIPARPNAPAGGYDPRMSDDAILAKLNADDRAA